MITALSNGTYWTQDPDHRRVARLEQAHEAYFEGFAALGFDSAKPNRLHSSYTRTIGSADSVLDLDREKLVTFSRQMHDNSVPFRTFTDRFIDLVLGTGLTPRGTTDEAKHAVELFNEWCEVCDDRGHMDFGEMQRMGLREVLVAGDCPIVKTSHGCLQYLETEQLRDPYGSTASDGSAIDLDMVHDGVEVDGRGRIVRFWVSDYSKFGGYIAPEVRAIDAKYVLFPAYRTRSTQTHGVPLWAPALERFAMYEDYLDAVGVSANLAARLALLIKTQSGNSQNHFATAMGGTTSKSQTGSSVPGEANLLSLATGSIMHLRPGEDVETVQGAQPTTAFDSYSRAILGMLAAMAGAPIEVIMLDLTRMNYSTSRMAEYMARNGAAPFRKIIRRGLCHPAYTWWRARMILEGKLPDTPLNSVRHVHWDEPKRWSVDPGKEYEAENKAVEYNFKTREQVIRELGGEQSQVYQGRARETKEEHELGIAPLPMPGQQPAGDGSPTSTPKDKPEPKGDGEDRITDNKQTDEELNESLTKGEKLNGAQITAAIEILRQLKSADLTPLQAVELLIAVGLDPSKAQKMVDETEQAEPDSDDETNGD